ncbi:unnamed protein product [Candidula unifasciata]|uniref:Uncharacterized protein n=1 Tax=Candidula unifasciata TaxID=100452 RepID=A0A8S3ZD04_9EUPU|nr:unnamed protein product [Candidula unifasciata]
MDFCGGIYLGVSAFVALATVALSQTYADTLAIFKDKLGNETYSVDVNVSFALLTIVDVDDVSQSFNCNGFLAFVWKDEMLAWDPAKYGGQTMIHPQAKDIWRPRVILANTLEDRDIFAENNAPIMLTSDGVIRWFPGSTFPTSCALNMIKYPFDKQTCYIQLIAMGNIADELQFVVAPKPVESQYYLPNGEWELENATVNVLNITDGEYCLSSFVVTFTIRRNPDGILVNIVLPVVFLSFLNLWVFVIPVESGEKISYGTTVLMALSVFMTTMGAMLPVSSNQIPSVVIYLFVLLIISLLTVITSIVIVCLHHKEEKEAHHNRAKTNLNRITNKVIMVKGATSALENASFTTKNANKIRPLATHVDHSDPYVDLAKDSRQSNLRSLPNKYRIIGKYIDVVSLVIFFGAWLGITLGFLLEMSSK